MRLFLIIIIGLLPELVSGQLVVRDSIGNMSMGSITLDSNVKWSREYPDTIYTIPEGTTIEQVRLDNRSPILHYKASKLKIRYTWWGNVNYLKSVIVERGCPIKIFEDINVGDSRLFYEFYDGHYEIEYVGRKRFGKIQMGRFHYYTKPYNDVKIRKRKKPIKISRIVYVVR